ncbi:uncharacterized protein V1510DRAFT_373980 [Dipodascopsis tothii]|uniref:uncharacterized protein n=1 Tax=Dipodascopsis tothii TaxID=44089 RepID=UPI0034CEE1D9
MKIQKTLTSAKRLVHMPPSLEAFIAKLETCPLEELPAAIRSFGTTWDQPRGVLHHWIPVLNRFDGILEDAVKKSGLDGGSPVAYFFEPAEEALLVAVLDFTTMLIENSSHRSLYASGTHLSALLYTTSLPVLVAALKVCSQLAQRYALANAGRSGRALVAAISQEKMFKLATSFPLYWPAANVEKISLLDFVRPDRAWNPLWATVHVQYYNSDGDDGRPRPSQEPRSDAMQIYDITPEEIASTGLDELFARVCADLPKEFVPEAFLMARVAKSFVAADGLAMREQLLTVHALVVEFLAYLANDSSFSSRLQPANASWIPLFCELIHPDNNVPLDIQSLAFETLTALSVGRQRHSETLQALSANVNHGILLYIVRELIKSVSAGHIIPQHYSGRLYSFIQSLTSQHSIPVLVSAGFIPVLTQLVEIDSADYATLAMNTVLVHSLVCSSPQGLTEFVQAGGVDKLVNQIAKRVDHHIAHPKAVEPSAVVDYQMDFIELYYLKSLVKLLFGMMQSNGSPDQLRNLIESSILSTLAKIFLHPKIIGSSVVMTSVDIMSTFIHNEPTSYNIISESKLPQVFIDAVPELIKLPKTSAIPYALGAICLNNSGLELVKSSGVIASFFEIFKDPAHVQTISLTNVPGTAGVAFDELVRHQPSLKDDILAQVVETIKAIIAYGAGADDGVRFFPVGDGPTCDASTAVKQESPSTVATMIECYAKFLESFFETIAHCKEFIKRDGLVHLVRLYTDCSLPYDFSSRQAAYSLATVVRLCNEANTFTTVTTILKACADIVDKTSDFADLAEERSFFTYLETVGTDAATAYLRSLFAVHNFAFLLSQIYKQLVYTHSKSVLPMLQPFSVVVEFESLLMKLGKLQRACIWERIYVTKGLSDEWRSASRVLSDDPWRMKFDNNLIAEIAEAEAKVDVTDNRYKNVKTARYMLSQLPEYLSKIFSGISKLVLPRRVPDTSQKRHGFKVAENIAQILVDSLAYPRIELFSDEIDKYAYWLLILSVAQFILIDDRRSVFPNIQTVTVICFKRVGGIKLLIQILEAFWSEGKDLALQYQGEKLAVSKQAMMVGDAVVLQILASFVDAKSVTDSTQTLGLMSSIRDSAAKPDYFHANKFLVELRCAILPVLRKLWESDVTDQVSTGILRSVIKTMTAVMAGASETGDLDSGWSSARLSWKSFEPSEETARQLLELGFSRPTIEQGTFLGRASAALLARQDADGDAAAAAEPAPADDADAADEPPAQGSTLAELNAIRGGIRRDIVERALKMMDAYPDLVYEIARLFIEALGGKGTTNAERQQAVLQVLQVLASTDVATAASAKRVKQLCHFTGLVLENATFFAVCATDLLDYLDLFVSIIKMPKADVCCLPDVLLILEKLLAESVQPREMKRDRDDAKGEFVPMFEVPKDARQTILDALLGLDAIDGQAACLAVTRVLIILSRDHAMATRVNDSAIVPVLFGVVKTTVQGDLRTRLQTSLLILLRHIVDRPDVLHGKMAAGIKRWFAQSRQRNIDVPFFVRDNHSAALRDPDAFVRATTELCKLTPIADPTSKLQHIDLAKRKDDDDAKPDAAEDDLEMADSARPADTTSALKALSIDKPAGIVQFLLGELLATKDDPQDDEGADAGAGKADGAGKDGASQADGEDKPAAGPKADADADKELDLSKHSHFLYKCYLLKCLTELTGSYLDCKLELINFSRKSAAGTPLKPRPAILHYFLGELLPSPAPPRAAKDDAAHKQSCLSMLTRDMLLSLMGTGYIALNDDVGDEAKLSNIRKFVLDAVYKSLKDAMSSTDSVVARYSRLTNLCSLCFALLAQPTTDDRRDSRHGAYRRIAQIMFEKNFVGLFTSILAEIDVVYPGSQKVVRAMLRTLSKLASTLIDMSGELAKARPADGDDDDFPAGSDDDDEPREHTPNLFSNSALGMFEVNEDTDYVDGDSDNSEMDDDVGEEMDFADEDGEDSDDDGDTVDEEEMEYDHDSNHDQSTEDEEDEEDEDMDVEIVVRGHVHDHDDESVDDDGDESGDDDDDEMDEDEIMHELEDEDDWDGGEDLRGYFSGVESELNAADDAIDEGEDDDDDDDDDGDDSDDLHAADDMVYEDDLDGGDDEIVSFFDDNDMDYQRSFVPNNLFYINAAERRYSGPDGRWLAGALTPVPDEDTTNPLLEPASDELAPHTTIPMDRQFHSATRALSSLMSRGTTRASGEDVTLLNDIVHHLSRHSNGEHAGPMRVRPDGMLIHDYNPLAPARGRAHGRMSRDDIFFVGSKLLIAPSEVRWRHEAHIIFPTTKNERANRLVNQIINVLLPPALEAEKERKEKELKELENRKALDQLLKEEQDRLKKEEQERKAAEEAERAAAAASAAAAAPPAEDAEMADVDGPAADRPRVLVNIGGEDVDITDMDIDPEFLEALPPGLREEVFTQHMREVQANSAAVNQQESEIEAEFLAALPSNIRDELLQQEAAERRRMQRETEGQPADDMDMAGFLASLDPTLRQSLLMEQDDEQIAQLPGSVMAEAMELRGRSRLQSFSDVIDFDRIPIPSTFQQPRFAAGHDAPAPKHDHGPTNYVQLADRAGISSLVRLLFLPQGSGQHNHLHDILQQVCANRQSRVETIGFILSVLQDGTVDSAAVEKAYQQLTSRAKYQPQVQFSTPSKAAPAAPKTPLSTPGKAAPAAPAAPGGLTISPLTLAQQCLRALEEILMRAGNTPSYFLVEHETHLGLKRMNSRKGKLKDGAGNKASRYPINTLLGLLDRPMIRDSAPVMDTLSTLFQDITKPLHILLKDKDEDTTEARAEAKDEAKDAKEAEAKAGDAGDAREADGDARDAGAEPDKDRKKPHKRLTPPQVPEYNLCLVVNILTAKECSSRTFQQTLAAMQNLCAIPGARNVFGEELIRQAQSLAKSLLGDLTVLCGQIKAAKDGSEVQGVALSQFSSASSDQAKLLRVLTAVDYLLDPEKNPSVKVVEKAYGGADQITLESLYSRLKFDTLWKVLGDSLTSIQDRPDMLHVATVLLPLMETLMVVCKHTGMKEPTSAQLSGGRMDLADPDALPYLFFLFTEDHRKILNQMVRNNPKLMSGSFSILVKNPKVLDFDNKRNYFNRQLRSRAQTRLVPQALSVNVRRDQVFLDSYKALYFKTGDEIKYAKLNIRFHGEEGIDAGGVTREWFQVLARQMFNPDYALFAPVASDRNTFHPNRTSAINPEHLLFFKFIGRIIGKALYDGRVLDCHFSRAVYKRILSKEVSLKDMETLDLEYYKSLVWMLENDITDVITECMSIEADDYGDKKVIALVPDGPNIPVTEANKQEYVRLVVKYRLLTSVEEQLESFLTGFYDIVPKDLVSIFNEQELELLISGLPDIDVDDWRNNTDYQNYSASAPQIQWFWRAVRSFDAEERAKLLQFATGTSKVPLNGFRELEGMNGVSRFSIHRDYGAKDRLPSSHTCFNQIDLPEYDSYEALRSAILMAITEGREGFGFA